MCIFCRCKTERPASATYALDYMGRTIIVKNVPCVECEQCGEKYFSHEVALRLEEIVSSAKKAMLDTAIAEYTPFETHL